MTFTLRFIREFDVDVGTQLAAGYYGQLHDEGLWDLSFPQGEITNLSDWLEFVSSPLHHMFFAFEGDRARPIGHVHLSNFMGYAAMIHFSITKAYHGKESVNLGEFTVQELFKATRKDKTPYVTTLIGLTPKWNRAACVYLRRLKFKPIDVIESAYYIQAEDTYSDGILSKRVRRSTQQGE